MSYKNFRIWISNFRFLIFKSSIFGPHSNGMTLIEVILAIMIFAILATVAIPKSGINIFQSTSVDGAACMIASDIRYAQECAMASQISKSVIFNSGSSTYTFNPPGDFDPTGRLPSGVIIQNNFTVTFNSLGEPIVGGGGSVTVSDGDQTRVIHITNYTGKVNIS